MELTGRLTADAEIRKATNNRELVTFTVAVNDYYKTKDGEKKEATEFFNCAYWLSTKIADVLLKGCIVTVSGWVYLNEYKGKDGNLHAQLAVHVNHIRLIAKSQSKSAATATAPVTVATNAADDLPF